MRGLKVTLIMGSCLALTGCSSVWADVSDFVSGKPSQGQAVATYTAQNQNAQTHSSSGSYVPATYGVDLSPVDCPAGTYLTTNNTCMLQDGQSYQTAELRGLSNPNISYQSSSTFISFSEADLNRFNSSLTGPLICPDGMILDGAYDCRFPDSISRTMSTPSFSTSAKSYSYEYACPIGSYKDPENICMRTYSLP